MKTKFDTRLSKRLERMIASPEAVIACGNAGPFIVISQRNFKGLSLDGAEMVAPVYDDILAHPELNVAAVMMDGLWAIIDIFEGHLLTDFEYDSIEFAPADHCVVLMRDGKKGLFDVITRSVSRKAEYYEISKAAGTRYTWSYSPIKGYEYYDSLEKRSIPLGHGVDECFDETHGHIFVIRDGMVQMLTTDGLRDIVGYRRLLAANGGRLTLYNSSRGVSVVADIYGNIL